MYVAQNIKLLRKKLKLTQEELANKIGKTSVSISDYEKGRSTPPYDTAVQLCEIFGVSLDQLIKTDLEKEKYYLPEELADKEKDYQAEYEELQKQYRLLERLTNLQEQRLAELEREIREHAPALARRLGLE